MPDLRDFGVPGGLQDEVDECRQVFGAHVFPVEHPLLFALGVQGGVFLAEPCAAVVTQPHIVSLAC